MVRALKAAERMQEVLNHYLQRIRRKGSGERQAAREEIYAQLVEQKLAQPA